MDAIASVEQSQTSNLETQAKIGPLTKFIDDGIGLIITGQNGQARKHLTNSELWKGFGLHLLPGNYCAIERIETDSDLIYASRSVGSTFRQDRGGYIKIGSYGLPFGDLFSADRKINTFADFP